MHALPIDKLADIEQEIVREVRPPDLGEIKLSRV
jgi:hypothetical protein